MFATKNLGVSDITLQQPMDIAYEHILVPETKLDADHYIAQDLDGVTESVFGSGNLNFLIMQSTLTNSALNILHDNDFHSSNVTPSVTLTSPTTNFNLANSRDIAEFSSHAAAGSDRLLADSDASHNETHGAQHATSLSSLNTSGLSSFSIPHEALHTNGPGSFNGSGSVSTEAGMSHGTDGASGTNGTNGSAGGSETTIVNVTNVTDTHLGDIINAGDITHIITTTTSEIATIIQTINLNNVLNLTDVTNNITSITDTILDGVNHGGLAIELDTVISEIPHINLDVLHDGTITNILNQTIDLSPITNLIDNVVDLHTIDLTDLHTVISVFDGPQNHGPGDTDLGLGIETALGDLQAIDSIVDLAFNPVEDVVGDIDILADLGLHPFETGSIDNGSGDTDFTGAIDIDLIDSDLAGTGLDINLDPVESIVGDIDLNIGTAVDLLGHTADGAIDTLPGGGETPSLLSDLGGTLTDTASVLLPANNASPDTDVALNLDTGVLHNDVASANSSIILDVVENVTGDLDIAVTPELDLLGHNEVDNTQGDSDLHIETGLDLVDNGLAGGGLDINLDPVEHLTGDIDLNIDVAADIFGQTADPLIDSDHGGNAGPSLLSSLSDELGDLTQGLLPHNSDSVDTDLSTNMDASLLNHEIIVADPHINLDIVENITGDTDVSLTPHLDLLSDSETSNASGDTDLQVQTSLDLVDNSLNDSHVEINLDPVEHLTGDIDLNASLGDNILGHMADPVIDTFSGGSGDTPVLSQLSDHASDMLNIVVPSLPATSLDLHALDPQTSQSSLDHSPITIDFVDVPVSPIEHIISDIDHHLDLGTALNNISGTIQGGAAISEGVLGGMATGSGTIVSWPENTLPSAGDLGHDAHSGGGLDSVLPAPVGTIAEGLGALDLHHGHSSSHGGGLFG